MNGVLASSPYAFDTAGQQSRAQTAMSKLRGLTRQQQVVDDKRRGIAQEKLMPGQMPRSPFLSERDYLIDKNRQGEIASLTSELSGKGPVKAQYGGTMGAATPGGSMGGPPLQRLLQMAQGPMSDDETHRFKMGQMDIEDRINQREADVIGGMKARWNDPEERLHSGRTGIAQRKIGDIQRDEAIRDATAGGTAEAERYFAPGQREFRREQMWDAEERAKRLTPYLPATINAQGNMGAASIRRDATLGAAETNRDARVASSAVNSLGRLAGTPTFTPEDAARAQEGTDVIRPLIPGQQPGAPQGGKPFPANMLEAFTRENGFQSPEQAKEYLRAMGYAVQ